MHIYMLLWDSENMKEHDVANFPVVWPRLAAALERGGDISHNFENRLDDFGSFSTWFQGWNGDDYICMLAIGYLRVFSKVFLAVFLSILISVFINTICIR